MNPNSSHIKKTFFLQLQGFQTVCWAGERHNPSSPLTNILDTKAIKTAINTIINITIYMFGS